MARLYMGLAERKLVFEFLYQRLVIKLIPCSNQVSMKFQLLMKTKMLKGKAFTCFRISDVVFVMLINVEIAKVVVILTFMSMTHDKCHALLI